MSEIKQKSKPRALYKQRFVKRDRAVKIIKELSEFLKILDLRESEILKTMIVRFAIESIEASLGSLLIYDKDQNRLTYQDTYIYENNKIILEDYGDKTQDITIRPGEGIVGESYIKGIPIRIENIEESVFSHPLIGEIVNMDINSVIAMPLVEKNEVIAVLEIANPKGKPVLTSDDLEIIMIISNFASTILENAKLFKWAIHDSLTNLYNNHYFFREIIDEIERSRRYGRVFSLVIFDIDKFKQVNDGYGHAAGDKALQLLAQCILTTIRKEVDIPARYGGDEFVIVLPNTSAEEAYKVCERLSELIKSKKIETQDGRFFGFTLSIGISEYPKNGEEVHILFNCADAALYGSKKAGRDAITIYDDSMAGEISK